MPFDHKEYYKNNKDRINANKRKWRSKPENKVKDKLYKENNKDRANELAKIRRDNNKDLANHLQKIWREKNKDIVNHLQQKRRNNPQYQFVDKRGSWKRQGIIDSDYKLLYDCYKSQTHCWICLKEYKESNDRCIDHDHDSGEPRYICCRSCNISIVR